MAKALSLKLKEDVFEEVEEITGKIKVPRNTYINKALEFYNKFNQRKLLKKQLLVESKLVSANSLKVLHELEQLEDDLLE
jgi:hypothetical protein